VFICFAGILEIHFSDFCHTNYLNIYQTDCWEICSVGITLAVDERSEVIFFDPLRYVAMANKFYLFIPYFFRHAIFISETK